MAKPSLSTIATTNTFQNWLDKTNEMVGLFQQDAITASASGDTTSGDATLVGDFAATNLTASTKISAPTIGHTTGGNTIVFDSPISVTGGNQVVATFTQAGGAQSRYTTGSLSWDVGIEDTDGDFIMNNGGGANEFALSPAGRLTVPGLTVGALDLQATEATIGTLNVTTLDGLDTTSIAEDPSADTASGTMYFTNARVAGALAAGTGIDLTQDGSDVTSIAADMGEIATGIGLSSYYTIDSSLNARSYFVKSDGAGFSSTADMVAYEFTPRPSYVDTSNYASMTGALTGGTPYLRFFRKVAGSVTYFADFAAGLNFYRDSYFYGDINIYDDTNLTIKLDNAAGSIVAEGDITAFGTASDINLKENIEVIPNALDKVSQLRGITFNYKDKPEEKATGLIAQEVEQVLPGLVYEVDNDSGESYKALRYGNTVGLLVEAIKELQDRIVELEKRCDCNG